MLRVNSHIRFDAKYFDNFLKYFQSFRYRTSAVFNAFLSNLPQFLDQNYKMGIVVVPTTLLVLQYCPCSSHNFVHDLQNDPSYSLWNLEPHIRRCWIMSFFVILYKVRYCHFYTYLVNILLSLSLLLSSLLLWLTCQIVDLAVQL